MIYYVVEINGIGFVFENIGHAASFISDAAVHAKQGLYYCRRPDITMRAVSYDQLRDMFPEEYKKEENADENTASSDTDQTEG